jgi:acetyl esterase/lipase
MEIKDWNYDEFPEFTEMVEGAKILKAEGNTIGVRYFHNIEYAVINGTHLHLQILVPETRNEIVHSDTVIHPCVVFVQGSAWMEQDVFGKLPMVSKLSERGYVVAIVEYRHSGIAPFPAQAKDARNAVRFMRVHAREYNLDPERIIIAGDSSGGHTAMFAGIINDDDTEDNIFPGVSAEVKGIVNYYGSVSVMFEDANPTTLNHKLPDSPEGMEMGGVNLREAPELCRKLSVEENITEETDIAPTLIFHGTKDRVVNTRQSVNLYRRMKSLGKEAELYLIEGSDHGGPDFWSKEIIDIVAEFIERCLRK